MEVLATVVCRATYRASSTIQPTVASRSIQTQIGSMSVDFLPTHLKAEHLPCAQVLRGMKLTPKIESFNGYFLGTENVGFSFTKRRYHPG